MMIGKSGVPLTEYYSFDVAPDLSAFAFALKEGIMMFKSPNVVTEGCKESTLVVDKTNLRYIKFTYDQQQNICGLYAITMTAIWSFPNIQKETKKKLMTGLFKLYDVNQKGELFAVDETNKIYQFNILDKIDMWPYDEDKLVSLE